ncbi:MAG TPA: fibronectin type III domain-containing protein, partial [Nitrosarchaeum sp.]|nr:fibronectin type III domain-containing protein [Nitrosarchaeum sp.]
MILSISFLFVLSFSLQAFGQTPPGQPTSLTATPGSSSQVNLSWNAPSGTVTGYKIEVKSAAAGSSFTTVIDNTASTATTYTHSGVSPGTYVYQVSARNQAVIGPPSQSVFVEVLASQNIVPGPPISPSAVAVSPTMITISWNPPAYNGGPAVTGYRIDVKIGNGNYNQLTSNTGPVTSFSHPSLTTGTTYSYKIYAINSIGTSNPSTEVSATPTSTSSSSKPNPPTNLVANQVSSTQIDLSWTTPSSSSPITGYRIEERAAGGSFATLATTGVTNTYSRSGLSSGVTYTYRVFAISSAGTSDPSNEATPGQTTTGVPNPPTDLVVGIASNTSLGLSWKAPTSGATVTGYKIEVRVGNAGYTVLVANTGTTTTTYTHSGLVSGTTYTYRVSSVNSAGTSPASSEASGKPSKTTTPTNLVAVATAPNQVSLCWYAPTETFGQSISGYSIEKKLGVGVYDWVVEDTGRQSTSHVITGLTTGTTYTFVVSAVYPLGSSGRSNEATATPTAGVSASPPTCATSTSTPTPQTGGSPSAPTGL